jgi:hypothetical protein
LQGTIRASDARELQLREKNGLAEMNGTTKMDDSIEVDR